MINNPQTLTPLDVPALMAWRVLSALADYSRWNSRTQFRVDPVIGRRQIMRVKLFGLWLPVPVLIQDCALNSELRWQGGIPGLFVGSHYFRLVEDAGKTTLIQGEDFSGLLVRPLWPLLERELRGLYRGFNEEFKLRCEGGASKFQ